MPSAIWFYCFDLITENWLGEPGELVEVGVKAAYGAYWEDMVGGLAEGCDDYGQHSQLQQGAAAQNVTPPGGRTGLGPQRWQLRHGHGCGHGARCSAVRHDLQPIARHSGLLFE